MSLRPVISLLFSQRTTPLVVYFRRYARPCIAECPQKGKEKVDCWKCRRPVERSVFCPRDDCKAIQPPCYENHFQALQCPVSYTLDEKQLERKFRDLQRVLHPDRYARLSKEELALSEAQSTALNQAYQTLRRTHLRLEHLLRVHGIPLDEEYREVPHEVLLEVLEIREELEEAGSNMSRLAQIQTEASRRIAGFEIEAAERIEAGDLHGARDALVKLKYFIRILDQVNEKLPAR
eukprot:TRINITY_DN15346_c0_g1::TRINITY_DN15346_c0_g1_i1::g.22835::m.22835 TRINITY_DN15346_c0_g1::TRINITY_DN15346_c0_g1_i1::g.22835  ORF type:complete len:235 (+),score=-3.44,sp/Q8IWL3/HSC20_HUMAN/32.04/4e-25,HSCB_C/PF07743.8/2.4e+03,HSCB_C/PF07743.8/1.4e-13,DnaJ/PF00226.26/2.7e-07 TRINITY_DN15346_c0_g1_i1:49-753(+)